jgi:hypothetical protein
MPIVHSAGHFCKGARAMSDLNSINTRLGHIESDIKVIREKLPADLPVRLDRLEQSEASRKWSIRTLWIAFITAVLGWATTIFSSHK